MVFNFCFFTLFNGQCLIVIKLDKCLKKYHIYIYNSVLTCRQNIINSSGSAPLNATKIAVKKVSDVEVCMFGPELYLSMYECCFLACFCASQRVQRRKAELTLAQIHMGIDIHQTNCPWRHKWHFTDFRG